jgi:hypothetical protein
MGTEFRPMGPFRAQSPSMDLAREALGTFFLVLAAAGGGMMSHAFPGVISHTDAVVAPALTVIAIILLMGKVSGAGQACCARRDNTPSCTNDLVAHRPHKRNV